ncbi:MAG TPA: hypothetical protein VGL62_06475 [Vicinamibacterales bacterium]
MHRDWPPTDLLITDQIANAVMRLADDHTLKAACWSGGEKMHLIECGE